MRIGVTKSIFNHEEHNYLGFYEQDWNYQLHNGEVGNNNKKIFEIPKSDKKGAVIVCEIDRNKGILSYTLKDGYKRVAISSPELKSGELYFAISMSHKDSSFEIIG